jgi:phenylpropionate dioxygenase-like ring-hydroxylating dioxygenase large terminal subunit
VISQKYFSFTFNTPEGLGKADEETGISAPEIRALVQPARVHKCVYTDPDLFELEMDRVFGCAWLLGAHLRAPVDFVRARLGRCDVIIVRDENGAMAAFHNRCAHRGARLCATDRGSHKSFVCPYHGWSFRCDGRLASVPHPEIYPDDFRLTDAGHHLDPMPRVASYRGFVFASLAKEGPALLDHLGNMTEAIDNLIDRAPDGEISIAESSFALEYPCNWKIDMENANDVFHPPGTPHIIGNIEASEINAAKRECQVESAFLMSEYREQDRRIFSGRYLHVLRLEGNELKIPLKRVDLIDCDGIHTAMSMPC